MLKEREKEREPETERKREWRERQARRQHSSRTCSLSGQVGISIFIAHSQVNPEWQRGKGREGGEVRRKRVGRARIGGDWGKEGGWVGGEGEEEETGETMGRGRAANGRI